MKIFGKRIEEFDSFEKSVLHFAKYDSDKSDLEAASRLAKTVEECEALKLVHYKDKWDLYVYAMISMWQVEYAGKLTVFPKNMEREFEKECRSMCCGISQVLWTSVNDRKYWVGFDYGH